MNFKDIEMTKNLKLISAILELLFLTVASLWVGSLVFVVIHSVVLFYSIINKWPKLGSIFWIVINLFWLLPIFILLWRLLHFITAAILWYEYYTMKKNLINSNNNETIDMK